MAFPKSFGVLLYPQFELLDIAGPLEALICLSRQEGYEDMTLSIISASMEPVPVSGSPNSQAFANTIKWVPTHTLENAPHLDVLIIPGGMGSVDFETKSTPKEIKPYEQFIKEAYRGENGKQPLKFLMSVCNGSMLLRGAGVLDGEKATTNKDGWDFITSQGTKTHWVAKARWQESGRIWTTSGVSAGADGTLAWIEKFAGKKAADEATRTMEWIRAENADNDPFAELNGCKDVLPQ